jgi:DNA-binding NarL/FixJ family response regulator
MLRAASSQGKPTRPTTPASSAQGRVGEGRPSPSRILIVEDDFFVAAALENDLQEAGYEVVGTAATAEEAIKMAAERAPALAIMDIRLAGAKDGVEAAIAILGLYRVPSIFATAQGDVETRRRAETASPLGWVNKPYSADVVLAAIRSALGR